MALKVFFQENNWSEFGDVFLFPLVARKIFKRFLEGAQPIPHVFNKSSSIAFLFSFYQKAIVL